MTRKKVKFSHTKWLLPLWILLIGSIVLYMIAHAVQQNDSRHIRTLAELNAVTYGDNMIADLNAGINITDTLEQLLISTDGRYHCGQNDGRLRPEHPSGSRGHRNRYLSRRRQRSR